MNIELLPEKVEKLESVFLNILYLKPEDRIVAPNMANLEDLRNAINDIFDENKCTDVLYTLNTDKQFFGIRINPAMSSSDATIILSTDEKVRLVKYQIEFDSKLFDIGLDESELVAVTLYEIGTMMYNSEIFDALRATIDCNIVTNDDVISIRDSINHAQLIIFAIKDTMYKLSSLLFKDTEDLIHSPITSAVNLTDALISGKEKITSSISGLGESLRTEKPIILQWMFLMYKDMKINSGIIRDTLTDAKTFTASKLEIGEIDKTLASIDRINSTIIESVDLPHFFDKMHMSSLNEISLFKSLKKNGLRGIENDLYEYAMRVKNCTEANDAYLIMRGINNRLGVLEDYLYSDDMSDHDRRHWEDVAQQYRDLRITLSKKKLNDKQWGLYFNYSALDQLDKSQSTNKEE